MRCDDRLVQMTIANEGLITGADAAQAGLSAQQWLRRRDDGLWLPLAPGVWRHAATPPTWELRLQAALRYLGKDAAIAGRAAAAWWELDGFSPGPVEFVVPRRRRDERWFVVHTTNHWCRGDLLRHRGLRVTSPTRTILDLAGQGATPRELETAIDCALRQRRISLPTLTRRLGELGPGRRGVRLLRTLLLDTGGESYLERRFLRLLRQGRCPRPATQVVHRRDGGRIMRVDFQFTSARVIIEVSGRLGHVSDRDRQRDARRRNALQAAGWTVLEFTTADVLEDPVYVLTTVREHLEVGG